MGATGIISEIKKLPLAQRKKFSAFWKNCARTKSRLILKK